MARMRQGSVLSHAILFFLTIRIAKGLIFIQPISGTTFSSTEPNLIIFEPEPSDPPFIDLYLFSTSTVPFGPSKLRLLASSVKSSIGQITFTPDSKDKDNSNSIFRGEDVLPPSVEPIYSLVAVKSGEKNALAHSDLFNVQSKLSPNRYNHTLISLNSTSDSVQAEDPLDHVETTSININISLQEPERTPVNDDNQSTTAANFNPLPPGVGIGGLGDQRKTSASSSVSTSHYIRLARSSLPWLSLLYLINSRF
ncbi:hypothetical protein CROQUDRAFT_133407 [Cronartium quercuum f. sp. fusiforme G11]|uniref:Uncharacterized protein n=1 Tax=Cronartium quercuum f. sp. fusiforme G11 TaxID=708437 RepID=A0A9P6NM76_9BASI|nr:hypothetical protein CROQUDRAFT_133407 [Cronartium quercuum f. sp. fusiforme G11]